MLSIPTPIMLWNGTTFASPFNLTRNWYLWGAQAYAEQQPLVGSRQARWVEADTYPAEIYLDKQFPVWSIYYNVVNGFPAMFSLPYEVRSTDTHKFRYSSTRSYNECPELTIHVLNQLGSVDNSWALFRAKQTSVLFHATYGNVLSAFSTYYGCYYWLYNNSTTADGISTVTGYSPDNYTAKTIPINPSGRGFGLNDRAVITYNDVSWDHSLYEIRVMIDRSCTYKHQEGSTFQEEVFPTDILEGKKTWGMTMDIFMSQGQEKDMLENIFDSDGLGEVSVKLYQEGGSSYYIKFGCETATAVFHDHTSMNVPSTREGINAVSGFRFLIPQPEIEIKDGFNNYYSYYL